MHVLPDAASPASITAAGSLPLGRPYERILVVEDEPAFRRILARNLIGRGLQVREAETAAEALEAIAADRPNLLLLDINLPDRTGWDVLRELRSRGTEVPTIVISAVQVSHSRMQEFHPLAFLPKPFPLHALLRLVLGAPRVDGEPEASEKSVP